MLESSFREMMLNGVFPTAVSELSEVGGLTRFILNTCDAGQLGVCDAAETLLSTGNEAAKRSIATTSAAPGRPPISPWLRRQAHLRLYCGYRDLGLESGSHQDRRCGLVTRHAFCRSP